MNDEHQLSPEEKRELRIRRGIGKIIGAAVAGHHNLPRVEEIAERLIGAMGGVEKFTKDYAKVISKAKSEKVKADGFLSVVKMVGEANDRQEASIDLGSASATQLDKAIEEYVRRIIKPAPRKKDGEDADRSGTEAAE